MSEQEIKKQIADEWYKKFYKLNEDTDTCFGDCSSEDIRVCDKTGHGCGLWETHAKKCVDIMLQQAKTIQECFWQLCPKCNGTGFIYSPHTMSTGASNTCDICNGAKILTKPIVEASQSDAVEFANWLAKYYWYDGNLKVWINLCDLLAEEKLTTEELYQIFKNKP